MWKKFALATAIIASLLAPTAAYAVPASLADPNESATYVRTAYDGTIWEVTANDAHALSYAEWSSLGFPQYSTAEVEYFKVLTLPTVYAITWFNNEVDNYYIDPIDMTEYRRGKPTRVHTVPWLDGLTLIKWGTSADMIVYDPNMNTLKLTYAQWRNAGFPAYQNATNEGFVKMSWDRTGAVAYMCDIAQGRGFKLTFAEWKLFGSPTPKAVKRVANDLVYSRRESPRDLFYYGPTVVQSDGSTLTRHLTAADWAAMGRPASSGQLFSSLPALPNVADCGSSADVGARIAPQQSITGGIAPDGSQTFTLTQPLD